MLKIIYIEQFFLIEIIENKKHINCIITSNKVGKSKLIEQLYLY